MFFKIQHLECKSSRYLIGIQFLLCVFNIVQAWIQHLKEISQTD